MINKNALAIIRFYESLHDGDLSAIGLQPKRCPVGIWTIGYGRALRTPDGKRFLNRESDKTEAYRQYGMITEPQAEQFLLEDTAEIERFVIKSVRKPLTENQKGALVSLAYNIGNSAFSTSTVLRKLNEGDYQAAANAFGLWKKGTVNGVKKTLAGLVNRRAKEVELFNTQD
jgi:lysozyme